MRRLPLAALALLAAAPARAASPIGVVGVDCTRVEGWAQDPDVPATTIDVHLYFDGPAGDPAATGVPVTANLTLSAGCEGEQCSHGFRGALPLSRLDGLPHVVHAYGIDTADPNLELSASPATYTCPPLPITMGVKRHILSPPILEAWKFSTYFDLMKVGDVALAAVPEGPPVDAGPSFVVAEGTTAPLWLLDQGFRRPVPAEVAVAWRVDPATAAAMPAATLTAMPEGTPLSARPILAQGTAAAVYLLDDLQCAEGDPNPACPQPVDPTTGAAETTNGPDEDSTGAAVTDGEASSAGDPVTDGGPVDTSGGATTTDAEQPEAQGDAAGCGCDAPRADGWALLLLALAFRRRAARRR